MMMKITDEEMIIFDAMEKEIKRVDPIIWFYLKLKSKNKNKLFLIPGQINKISNRCQRQWMEYLKIIEKYGLIFLDIKPYYGITIEFKFKGVNSGTDNN